MKKQRYNKHHKKKIELSFHKKAKKLNNLLHKKYYYKDLNADIVGRMEELVRDEEKFIESRLLKIRKPHVILHAHTENKDQLWYVKNYHQPRYNLQFDKSRSLAKIQVQINNTSKKLLNCPNDMANDLLDQIDLLRCDTTAIRYQKAVAGRNRPVKVWRKHRPTYLTPKPVAIQKFKCPGNRLFSKKIQYTHQHAITMIDRKMRKKLDIPVEYFKIKTGYKAIGTKQPQITIVQIQERKSRPIRLAA